MFLKKILLTLLALLSMVPVAFAEGDEGIVPSISAEESIEINRSIIFDASGTLNPFNTNLVYEWAFGDGNRQQGVEVVHSYAEAGVYTVQLNVFDNQGHKAEAAYEVFAYKRSFVLVSNVTQENAKLTDLVGAAREEGIFINFLQIETSGSQFLEEEELRRQLLEDETDLENTADLVIYTSGSSGLTVLSQLAYNLSNPDFFAGKNIYFFSENSLGTLTSIAQGAYKNLKPKQIILTRAEALWPLLESADPDSFISALAARGVEYELVDHGLELRPWNFLTYIVNDLIGDGVPPSTILLVLMLPIIATVVAFMKQVIGLDTLGVYTPSILTLSFIALNFAFGLFIFLFLFIIAILARHILHRYRLLYVPRMAIILSLSSLSILVLFYARDLFQVHLDSLAIFPILIMTTMVEKFVTIQGDKGVKSTVRIGLELLVITMFCYFVAQSTALETFVLGRPEIVFLFVFFDFILARYTALRLTEYIRFRELINYVEE